MASSSQGPESLQRKDKMLKKVFFKLGEMQQSCWGIC